MNSPYTCRVAGVLNPEVAEVTQILGIHVLGRSNADVKGFRMLYDETFSALPRNLENFFPNLEALDFNHGGLTSISSDDLAPWPKLSVFIVASNKIETLDGDLFQHSPKLTWISFYNNLIRNVGANLLSNLNELKFISFRNNPCISTGAETPDEIESSKAQLFLQCPPLEEPETATVTVSTTADPARGSRSEVDHLRDITVDQSRRIETLEKTVRVMGSNPCSCSL